MRRVLIVDDEKFIRRGLKAMIERANTSFQDIIECANGKEALEHASNQRLDLIITDIRMPQIDGLELIKKLQEYTIKAKIIILSGYDDFQYAKEAMKYGVKAYLLKPVDRNELLETLSRIEQEIYQEEEDNRQEAPQIEDPLPMEFNYDGENHEIEVAIQYVKEHYNEDLNMAVVANYVSLNYYYFSHLFKEHTGVSFIDFLKNIRIEKAKELLEASDDQIQKVAQQVGYNNSKHFTKTFRHITGISPKEYRSKFL